ncbi:hypothetical protein [uncultured Arthrobacter sp.]|uniref:hypothetical protein n=1 Tax=uncultured Arthrobacter sp. TaxID=114050 RepID=UPI002638C52B|nr:hypothetical protein [uncultured Arthrobacter sp.]
MDRIENLIRGLDPVRAERESADSQTEIITFPAEDGHQEYGPTMNTESSDSNHAGGTSDGSDAGDAFSDDRPVVVPLRRRRRTAVILAGAAAAAVVAGAVVVGGSLGADAPLPAATTDPTPSVEPTGEATADPSPSPEPTAEPSAEPSGVPTGPPADEGCRVQDVDRVVEQGSDFMSLTPFAADPSHYQVVGCTDDWMAMEITDAGFEANPQDGGNAWYYVARRVDGQWLVETAGHSTLTKWEFLPVVDGRTSQEMMDQQFIDVGIPVELRPELVGDGPSGSEPLQTHPLTELGVVFDTRSDWEVVPASQGVDLVNAEGTKVANLQHSSASGLGGVCSQDPVPWQELASVPVSVTVPGGAEVAARFTLRVFEGDPLLAAPSLIAADQPSSGESCMLYNVISGPETGLLALTTTFTLSPYERGSALEFNSMAEAEAYAASEEFAQLAAIADSITVTD